jgi:Tfp pilus assembly protein PilO
MILAYLLLLTGLTISAVAIYYSVVGLTAIFSAAAIPIIIMGSALEVGKLVCASWLKANWERAPRFMKYYMTIAVIVLMLITSMGIFGFLSKAHNDQTLVSGDVGSKIAIYDEKIKTAKENIEADRKQLKQMDEAVDQIMGRSTDEKGADKANAVRKSQQKDRISLAKDIETQQKLIASLNDEAAPIRAEVRKVEAEVGPIKYIAAFLYGTAPDESMLERAVTWIIILIVIVFDPLAVIMLLASQMTFAWQKEQEQKTWIDEQAEDLTEAFNKVTVAEPIAPIKEELEVHPDEGAVEPVPPTADNTQTIIEPTESELDKWNKMIEEAERAAAETEANAKADNSLEERVASGESYIDSEGKEMPNELEEEISKKKTYMMKDDQGTVVTKVKE